MKDNAFEAKKLTLSLLLNHYVPPVTLHRSVYYEQYQKRSQYARKDLRWKSL